jgi:hypothetical protein
MTATGQFFLGSVDAAGVTKDGQYLSQIIKKYIKQIGEEHIVCVVTDNASNCQEAGLLLETEYPFVTWLGCLPHCLNLLLKDLAKISWVEKPVKKASMVRPASSSLNVHTSGSSGAFAASNQTYK